MYVTLTVDDYIIDFVTAYCDWLKADYRYWHNQYVKSTADSKFICTRDLFVKFVLNYNYFDVNSVEDIFNVLRFMSYRRDYSLTKVLIIFKVYHYFRWTLELDNITYKPSKLKEPIVKNYKSL